MFIQVGTKSAIAVALLVALSACGSSSSDSEETVSPEMEVQEITDVDPTSVPDTVDNPIIAADPPTTALFGPPQYITSECGSLEVSGKVSSNALDTPPEMLVGELVSGQIVPNSTTDNFHYWQITLEPGNYHLVADASVLEEDTSSIGILIESIAALTADNARLATDVVNGFDLRLYEFIEIQAAQTLTLKVEARFDTIHNYTFGFFGNGTAVPSPTFNRCLPINTLSLDSTQSVTLPGSANREDDNWYLIDLEDGQYQLDASTSSAESRLLGYTFTTVDQFGQTERIERVASDTASETLLTTSDTFESDGKSLTWVHMRNRLRDRDDELTVEFTVSQP